MKRFLPIIVLVLAGLWLASSWVAPKPKPDDFDLRFEIGDMLRENKKIQPLDFLGLKTQKELRSP